MSCVRNFSDDDDDVMMVNEYSELDLDLDANTASKSRSNFCRIRLRRHAACMDGTLNFPFQAEYWATSCLHLARALAVSLKFSLIVIIGTFYSKNCKKAPAN